VLLQVHIYMPMCEVVAECEPPAPPICPRGVLWSYMTTADSNSVGRFDQKLAAQRLFPSLSSWSPSCLTQAQQLATRRMVPYIARDGQWECGIDLQPYMYEWRTQHEE
jgi:hypothetical protein